MVETVVGTGEGAGQEAVDQPSVGAVEVGDEGVRAGIAGRVLAQGREFGPQMVRACGEHLVEALGGAAGRAAAAVDEAHAAAHGAGEASWMLAHRRERSGWCPQVRQTGSSGQ